jgi:Rieske Fe-S protein
VAAGFSGTGLTFGTAAALLLRDLVTVGASPWSEAYSPRRLKPLASGLPIARENLEIGWHFVADRLRAGDGPELALDQGRIERSGRRQVAVYRDLRGDLHFLSPRCPHLGCIVGWNGVEKTWDCPCHGGRFAPTGKVLYGPPTEGLAHVSPDGAEEEKDSG